MDWTLEPYQKYSGHRASRHHGRPKITSHYYHAADGMRGISSNYWMVPSLLPQSGPKLVHSAGTAMVQRYLFYRDRLIGACDYAL